MAENDDWGGVPINDDWGGIPLDKPKELPIERGGAESFGRGTAQGLTAGFYDELRGLGEAGGTEPGKPLGITDIAKGAYRTLTGDEEAKKKYEETKAREQKALEESKEQHPYLTGTGEIAGAVGSMAALPGVGLVKGTGYGANVAKGAILGGEYGALSGAGEGEGTEGRLTGAGTGAVSGVVGGAGASAVTPVLGAVVNRYGKPVLSTIRGWANPEAEAGRRITGALAQDMVDIASGKAQGMSLSQWQAAKAMGEPVTLADLGAGNTQAFLRSAANTSPEGRAIIEKVINERFEGQGDRLSGDIRKLVSGGANASKTRDQLLADYEQQASPAYKKAFEQPAAQSMWHEGFEQISQAPVVQEAIRGAMVNAKNEAAKMGLTPPANPFVKDATGRFVLDPDSGLSPTLQFWDVVKKNLDRIGGREGQFWARELRGQLDQMVPEYGNARGIAAKYFGEDNALDAGRTAATKRMSPDDLAKVMRSMKPEERDLFREGWADSWANKVMEIRDRSDVTGRIFESPNERTRAGIVFGSNNLGRIETRINLEKIFDGARKALGNSTTARQLIESGLAGGAIGGYFGNWDPRAIVEGAGIGAGARGLAREGMVSGAQKMIGYVDKTTAKKVAELLVSDDPQKLAAGIRMAVQNRKISEGLGALARRMGVATQAPTLPQVANKFIPRMGTVPATAEPEQNKRDGGRTNKPDQSAKNGAPVHGARRAPDGRWYVADKSRPGKFLRVET